jgi:hypothetical protein
MLHQSLAEALDLALQRVLEKRAAGLHVVLDLQDGRVHYRPLCGRHRLGPLEKRILLMLAEGPLTASQIAKTLQAQHHSIYIHPVPGGGLRSREVQTWHQSVCRTLKGLRRKGLVESQGGLGRILAGTQIVRRFYTLNPEKISTVTPIHSPTKLQLQRAKEKAQTEAIQREKEGIRLQCLLSPKPSTRLKALINQGQNL